MDYIESLDIESFEKAWASIEVIEAQRMLNDLNVTSYCNLTKENQKKIHKALYKSATNFDDLAKKQSSMEDFVSILSNKG